ncbi:MAG: cyclic nucleotide-binding domain-containing protein [Actinobacteria bacterium]|nr:cyclic nucleotide-binding domain-containing protein [Actinomycetota bacterium]
MRIESSVTTISWIPSESMTGPFKLGMDLRLSHYDAPPPEAIEGGEHLERLRDEDAFRYSNRLDAWIEVEDGQIVDHGQSGGIIMGSTSVNVGGKGMTFAAVTFPELRPEPEVGPGWVRFQQTVGGRTGAPMPRPVTRPPFVQWVAPTTWTTLSLTLHADGRTERELVGASPFPRHWVYDDEGKLTAKSGLLDFKTWLNEHFGDKSPWGEGDSEAVVSEVETQLERELSRVIMGGGKPKKRKVKAGEALVEQGAWGSDLFLLLDGQLSVEIDGEAIAEVGPGAILGERAILEGGKRTSTLRAVTPAKVAVASSDQVDREALVALAEGHRREDGRGHGEDQ